MSDKIQKKFFDMSHPKYNYLGHFKEDKFMRQGHNDSADMSGFGLSQADAAEHIASKSDDNDFQKSFNSQTGMAPIKAALSNPVSAAKKAVKMKKATNYPSDY